jgi:hypothetical protein
MTNNQSKSVGVSSVPYDEVCYQRAEDDGYPMRDIRTKKEKKIA